MAAKFTKATFHPQTVTKSSAPPLSIFTTIFPPTKSNTMQYPIQVEGIYAQTIQTIHPDILTVVKFSYTAEVEEDESVTIKSVYHVDGPTSFEVRLNPFTGFETSMQRFLAEIREHARVNAYIQAKFF